MAERARPSPVPVQSEGRPATVVDAGTVAAPTAGVRRCCVLDVESAPDRFARVLSGRRTAVSRGSPLNEVVNVSYVGFDMAVDGSFSSLTLRSFHRAEYSEVDILGNVQDALAGVADDGGMLATFNGRAFDLPLLRLRQMRWWLCEADAVARIAGGDAQIVERVRDAASVLQFLESGEALLIVRRGAGRVALILHHKPHVAEQGGDSPPVAQLVVDRQCLLVAVPRFRIVPLIVGQGTSPVERLRPGEGRIGGSDRLEAQRVVQPLPPFAQIAAREPESPQHAT